MAEESDGVVEEFKEWIRGSDFSCLGARVALRRRVLETVLVGHMDEPAAVREVHVALESFVGRVLRAGQDFASLVVLFNGPLIKSEAHFEQLLWEHMAALRDVDRERHQWAPGVGSDPESPDFAFSVVEHPFFVVGMHPLASRRSRRSSRPAVAFNSHLQFDRLKANGTYFGLQRRIRAREIALQGSVNPSLADFGTTSEARQYAGRDVGESWRCPFQERS